MRLLFAQTLFSPVCCVSLTRFGLGLTNNALAHGLFLVLLTSVFTFLNFFDNVGRTEGFSDTIFEPTLVQENEHTYLI